MDASRIVKPATVDGRTVPMVEFKGKRFVPASDEELRRAKERVALGENVLVGLLDSEDGVWIEPIAGGYPLPVCLTRVL